MQLTAVIFILRVKDLNTSPRFYHTCFLFGKKKELGHASSTELQEDPCPREDVSVVSFNSQLATVVSFDSFDVEARGRL